MNDLLIERWKIAQDKLRKLNIVAGVDWDTTPDNRYVTNVYTYEDVKLKSLHHETYDLQDMVDQIEGYYEHAKNAEKWRKTWDGISSVWWAWVSAWTFLTSFTFFVGSGLIIFILYDRGMWPQIIEMLTR